MHTFTWNERCLFKDGEPWYPMMGEIHYARCPEDTWELELAKMKAGGVDIAASYAFWIHHEAEEGHYDFSGRRNLRRFIHACAGAGLNVWLRIGPWCHGEVRNGGFPDWLLNKPWTLRDNDESYLQAVERYWAEIARQTEGLWHGQGGPIIGLQIENEYGHCGGAGNRAHMDALLALSRKLGMQPAYVSATGWGGAVLGTGKEILPVMSAYCDAPWDHRKGELPANPNYLFSDERNDVDVGSDFRKGEHLSFDPSEYPFLTAELGGGMQSVHHRRPYLTSQDTAAMSLCKVGSGAALLGYYMYHGGTNPGYNLQESLSSGGYCELPELSYDYRCPIRAFGQITPTCLELKLFAMFFRDFGGRLAAMDATIPEDTGTSPEDRLTPRWSYRSDGHSAFIFVNNHQRKRTMPDKVLTLTIPTDRGDVTLRNLNMPGGAFGFYPVNFRMGSALMRTAHATPLCCLNGKTYVFYSDGDPMYDIVGSADILTLCRKDALNSWKITVSGKEALVVSNAPVVRVGGQYLFLAKGTVDYTLYWDAAHSESGQISVSTASVSAAAILMKPDSTGAVRYQLCCQDDPTADDVLLSIEYEGDMAQIHRDGQKAADDIYDGFAFEISLRRLGFENLTLSIAPLRADADVFMDRPPLYENGVACRLKSIKTICEYRIPCPWKP